MKNHPQLIELYHLYNKETQAFRKVHRMIDLFESIIKTHTVIILGEYFKQNKHSNSAKGLLANGLRTPSLGTWQLFSRVLYSELKAENYVFFNTDFSKEFEKLDKDLNNVKTNIISFRNEYAHGATPSDELCKKDIARYEPFLLSLLESKWLKETTLSENEGKVYIDNINSIEPLCLYPILVYKPEPDSQPFVFFNDLKNDKVGLLNYPLSKHYKDKDFYSEFNTYLPLKEWKKSGSSEFYQRIEELTETFKGRTQERMKIREFVEKNDKGYFSIQGNPGIGKSALIAQIFKDLSSFEPKLPIKIVEYFIRRGTAQANPTYFLSYLIKATDNNFPEGKTIQAEGKANWDLQQQLFAKWRNYEESNPKEKLVFFIDGLDEGIESEILRYLPRDNFNQVLIIYGSRPGGHKELEAFWSELPVEHRQSLLLSGLSKNDIRALLYEVGNKYQIDKESTWIDSVEQRSEGNPLYLKLLCNAIENGSIEFNDAKALPTEINDYYKAILNRYANDSIDGDALLSSLYVFAAAYDYLTPVHLQLINGLGTAQSHRIESTLKEVLYENPLTEDVLDYQLFHESFREFLMQFYPTEIKRAETKLLDFCSTWDTLDSTFEQRYALQHYTTHLIKNRTEKNTLTLIKLSKNKQYTDTQKKILRGFYATKTLFQDTLLTSLKTTNTEEAIDAALSLIDVKYEEQNDVATILAMVANNEIELALQRITTLGGESKEEKQRQFTLYMLCFMELTLLESKTQTWRKNAIEKLLTQFEEQIPIDHSLIRWNYFFPSYLMFLLAVEIKKIDLDFKILYLRTYEWDSSWISDKGPYADIEINILQDLANDIIDVSNKNSLIKEIAISLALQGNVDLALKTAQVMSEISYQYFATLKDVSISLVLKGNIDQGILIAEGISDNYYKSFALKDISVSLMNQGKQKQADVTIQQAVKIANNIAVEYNKCSALKEISVSLYSLGKIKKADKVFQQTINLTNNIIDEYEKGNTFREISVSLYSLGKNDLASKTMQQAIIAIQKLDDGLNKQDSLKNIFLSLAEHGDLDYALINVHNIKNKFDKCTVLLSIVEILNKQMHIELAEETMKQAITISQHINDEREKNSLYCDISKNLVSQGNIEQAFLYLKKISSDGIKNRALISLSWELYKQDKYELAIETASIIIDSEKKNLIFKDICENLATNGNFEIVVLTLMQRIKSKQKGFSELRKRRSIKEISLFLAEQGNITQAIEIIKEINIKHLIVNLLSKISLIIASQGKHEKAMLTIQQSIQLAEEINDDYDKCNSFIDISLILFKLGNVEQTELLIKQAITIADNINDLSDKCNAFINISLNIAEQESIEDAKLLMNKAHEFAKQIDFSRHKNFALANIAINMSKQGNYEDAIKIVKEIDAADQCIALSGISKGLLKENNIDHANQVMQQAITSANVISNILEKIEAYKYIALILIEQDKHTMAFDITRKIEFVRERIELWQEIGGKIFVDKGAKYCLALLNNLPNEEAILFYKKGIVSSIPINETTEQLVLELLPHIMQDLDSLEILLQNHALYCLFFRTNQSKYTKQLFKTIDIQWAETIANCLTEENHNKKLSTNLSVWLHEIPDEDDQDQVTLWAKQVAKGKISEEEFQTKIKELL